MDMHSLLLQLFVVYNRWLQQTICLLFICYYHCCEPVVIMHVCLCSLCSIAVLNKKSSCRIEMHVSSSNITDKTL